MKKSLNKIQKKQIVDLLLKSLGEKLFSLFGEEEKTREFLLGFLDFGQVFYEERGGKVVGFLAYSDNKNGFMNVSVWDFVKFFGFFEGIYRIILCGILDYKNVKGELHLEAVAVDGEYRGQGIGSELIEEFFVYADEKKYNFVSLEVVDTNLKARKLYEKLGFQVEKTSNLGAFNLLYKFSFKKVFTLTKDC